ncbi:uncharacterized protein LOC135428729 [Drosophila montana]|uniref:uncharacterized protein LOC135428729 n=1 Tax=Drosophila montana TaxID=40370 RepID=UPI00313B04F3
MADKSPEPDDISNSVIKAVIATRPRRFVDLYTQCIVECTVPRRWKLQRLVLIPKPSKEMDGRDHRPLCMLDTIGKILERIICNSLESKLAEVHGLCDRQSFRNLVGETLSENPEVRTLSHRVSIECKDLDEITTREDICEALRGQIQIFNIAPENINLRKEYGQTQTATIRQRKVLKMPFQCLELKHLTRHCKSELDRSNLCRRCGGEDHLAKDCKQETQCMLCKDRNNDPKHIVGSGRCPLRAIHAYRWKWLGGT